ncbi:hypothetical protein GCM10010420_39110 [Streptomyces glaucosporus]|uniref:Uncharacterized protein n=1 Tax=Streptomyces glaucosporus TaxID=284044 RepID=A0ABP5VQ87_9ACTN
MPAAPGSPRHETRALLRAHLAAAARYGHATRHCPVCHRLRLLAMDPADEPSRTRPEPGAEAASGAGDSASDSVEGSVEGSQAPSAAPPAPVLPPELSAASARAPRPEVPEDSPSLAAPAGTAARAERDGGEPAAVGGPVN